MPISDVAQKYNMRYECVYRLIEQHGYKYRGFEDIDLDSLNALIENLMMIERIIFQSFEIII